MGEHVLTSWSTGKKTLRICVEKKATEFANTLNRKCDIQLEQRRSHVITEPHCTNSTPLELLVQSFKFKLINILLRFTFLNQMVSFLKYIEGSTSLI